MADNLTDCAATRPEPRRNSRADVLRSAERRLRAAGSRAARLEAELLLARVLQAPRSHLAAWPELPVGAEAQQHFERLLQRATAGEPLAYLIGEREFWSLPLTVTPVVLIPRPETELLVERCLALMPNVARQTGAPDTRPRLCDLGTGSGAIALALARERPVWQITATDRSRPALQIARANAERLGVRTVEFLEGDWFAPLAARRFELIVSNPPYIAATDPALAALRYEPRAALTPGPDGLEALGAIIHEAPGHLTPGGWLVLEHGADQVAPVARRLAAAGFVRVRSHRDPAAHLRVTEAQWLR